MRIETLVFNGYESMLQMQGNLVDGNRNTVTVRCNKFCCLISLAVVDEG